VRIHRILTPAVALAILAVPVTQAMAASSTPSTSASPNAASIKLLTAAAKTESAAYLQYFAYADGATAGGQAALADVWQTVGEVEHQDHWTHEVTLANLYSGSDNTANLKTAVKQAEAGAAADTAWAAQAPKGSAAAQQLKAVAARQTSDAALLTKVLAAFQGKGKMPAVPAVNPVAVKVSAKAKYSGTFYNDLTSGSDSALEVAAWNWAEYQWDAKTAVDTGQAGLASVFSALEAQEADENWSALSNVAGYVQGNASNLQESIASEQGAIDMYNSYSAKADKSGDTTTGGVFQSIMGDETGHRGTFSTELSQLGS